MASYTINLIKTMVSHKLYMYANIYDIIVRYIEDCLFVAAAAMLEIISRITSYGYIQLIYDKYPN